ncbi:MAG: hypothetical protein BWY42_01810 [Candidatus Omnitrophica bacterium ADurb.Bin277]|nr:MAG: hypothetical protein BWY42_01810 [Candidatus Omnitrophica bacterium ADurb.Bin277]
MGVLDSPDPPHLGREKEVFEVVRLVNEKHVHPEPFKRDGDVFFVSTKIPLELCFHALDEVLKLLDRPF